MRDGAIPPAPIWTDARTFDARILRNRVHCIAAGYPCQPFSHAGKRAGQDDPRHLWPALRSAIRDCQPNYVFIENVEGHISLGFREVAASLRDLGYQGEAGIFSAEEIGAPHLRKRLFALAFRESGGCGELWQSFGPDRQPIGRGRPLADARHGLVPIAGRQPQERTGTRSTGSQLADARRVDQLGRRSNQESSGIGRAPTRRAARAASSPEESFRRSDAVGISQRERSQERQGKRSRQKQELPPFARAGLFAPGPAEFDEWAELLHHHPELEPAVRRTPDGASSRVDRLRALGNGVVPLTAGYAFATLARLIVDGVLEREEACRVMRARA